MKLTVTLILIISTIFAYAQPGNLEVEVTTSKTGGKYAPRNVLAIWVEDANGNFVKTLMAYGNKRKTHLNNWQESTSNEGVEYNTTDAISGATLSNHGTRNCTWDGTNYSGEGMAQGMYRLCFELTDKNSSGNFSVFDFTVDENENTTTPDDKPSFKNISYIWNPSTLNSFELKTRQNSPIYPGYTRGELISHKPVNGEIWIHDYKGQKVFQGKTEDANLYEEEPGIYIITIKTPQSKYTQKIIKL